MAEQWVETVDRNPDFDSWRYGRSELAALVRAIQADALRHAAEIVQKLPVDGGITQEIPLADNAWIKAHEQAEFAIISAAGKLERNH